MEEKSGLSCSLNDFDMVKAKIGSGASGVVDLMKSKHSSDTIYAVKTFHNKLSPDEEKHFFGEIETMAALDNQFILKIEGYQIPNETNEWKAAIVMEYAGNGSLRDMMRSGEEYDKVKVLWEIAHGMKYLHKSGKIHCDLKPENVMFGEGMKVKIGDFGLSRDEGNTMTMGMGTPSYMAPELMETSHYNRKVDVFAFGQMMIEVMSGEPIFPRDMLQVNIIAKMQQKQLPEIPESVEEPFRSLAMRCRSMDPEERPEFSEIEDELLNALDLKVIERELIDEYKKQPVNKLIAKIEKANKKIEMIEEEIEAILRPGLQLIRAIKEGSNVKAIKLIGKGVDISSIYYGRVLRTPHASPVHKNLPAASKFFSPVFLR